MSGQSGASHFQSPFEAALEDYKTQTGTKLDNDPLHEILEKCDTVESIAAVLQEQAQAFRGKDEKVMKSLTHVVHVLQSFSDGMFLRKGTRLVRPKAFISCA